METPVITVQSLSKQFRTAAQTVYAVRDVTFAIQRGEFVGIVGPSGSGKSTLLGLLGGLDTPSSGAVQLDGVDISHMRERELTRVRNQKIGFVFQFFNLIPALTALENVALPLHFAHTRQFQPEKRALELLNLLGLRDRAHHRPAELSGGQQQRVAIARAIANNPPLILADEPTGNLNVEAGRLVLETLKQIREQSQTTIVVVTHDSYVAEQADRVLNLIDGRLVAADALTPDHSA
ncbi:MAG: ABC transporter ATP-binding protein [Anaerolineales bacterium]|nr:ABC transporter ATP-binding protein [Anaerolineales bacterium]MCB8952686.1 ABC transporter ATP-binding protein [Ardenticatenales bacterium]